MEQKLTNEQAREIESLWEDRIPIGGFCQLPDRNPVQDEWLAEVYQQA